MRSSLLTKYSSALKKELMIVLGVIMALFTLPLLAIVSLTDAGALADSEITLYTGPTSTTNTYTYGYCTFWAALRREQIGKPIPNTWGHAHTWDDRAQTDGYRVDHTPTQYAIMESDAGPLGHVAFVERIDPDGSWTISEMNAPHWDVVSGRTFRAADARNYKFIH